MFEALQHLKNWKSHRETEVPEVDKDEFQDTGIKDIKEDEIARGHIKLY